MMCRHHITTRDRCARSAPDGEDGVHGGAGGGGALEEGAVEAGPENEEEKSANHGDSA